MAIDEYKYASYFSPTPIVDLNIFAPNSNKKAIGFPALIDTGCVWTSLPISLIKDELNLPVRRFDEAVEPEYGSGKGDPIEEGYTVFLEIPKIFSGKWIVLPAKTSRALIGTDILTLLILTCIKDECFTLHGGPVRRQLHYKKMGPPNLDWYFKGSPLRRVSCK